MAVSGTGALPIKGVQVPPRFEVSQCAVRAGDDRPTVPVGGIGAGDVLGLSQGDGDLGLFLRVEVDDRLHFIPFLLGAVTLPIHAEKYNDPGNEERCDRSQNDPCPLFHVVFLLIYHFSTAFQTRGCVVFHLSIRMRAQKCCKKKENLRFPRGFLNKILLKNQRLLN